MGMRYMLLFAAKPENTLAQSFLATLCNESALLKVSPHTANGLVKSTSLFFDAKDHTAKSWLLLLLFE